MIEEWKEIKIKGFEGRYEISNMGNVFSLKTKKKLKLFPSRYLQVTLRKKGKKKLITVHRLVAIAFLGLPGEEVEVNHKNGIKHDNRIDNLEWITHKDNIKHSRNVLSNIFQGEQISNSKLKSEDVLQIKQLLRDGFLQREVADNFGVNQTTISKIHLCRIWKHIE